jgi:hypothetical protein
MPRMTERMYQARLYGGRQHTVEEHQLTCELWLENHSFKETASKSNVAQSTVEAWASDWWRCPFGCPYHNWARLDLERKRIFEQHMQGSELGVVTPEMMKAHAEAILAQDLQTNQLQTANLAEKLNSLCRGDLERIAHWEFVYAKLFRDLTGIELDVDMLARAEDIKPELLDFAKGLHVEKAKEAIELLQAVQSEIDKIKQRNSVKPQAEPEGPTTVSIEELRRMRQIVESTNPKQLMSEQQGKILDASYRADA